MEHAVALPEPASRARDRAVGPRQPSAETIAIAEALLERVHSVEPDLTTAALLAEVKGLRKALESRSVIEQAKGIVVARTGCTPAAAFDILVRQSQHENRKLRDVAEHLVRAAVRPVAQPPSTMSGDEEDHQVLAAHPTS